jgi:hypothetical protein
VSHCLDIVLELSGTLLECMEDTLLCLVLVAGRLFDALPFRIGGGC